jgi:hypothetical protein
MRQNNYRVCNVQDIQCFFKIRLIAVRIYITYVQLYKWEKKLEFTFFSRLSYYCHTRTPHVSELYFVFRALCISL